MTFDTVRAHSYHFLLEQCAAVGRIKCDAQVGRDVTV